MSPGVTLRRCFDEDVDPGFDINAAIQSGDRVSLKPGFDVEKFERLMSQRDMSQFALGAIVGAFIVMIIAALTGA